LPVIIHSRNAESDTLSVMKSFPTVKGVLHCFTSSLTMAMEAIQLGYYISFSGIVTFTNARALHSVAAAIPLQSIIIETDSPYLTPHPFRGKTANHPKYLKYVAHKIAQLHNVTYDIVTKLTTKNSQQLFALAEQ
jgi:TatD DNase family protein